MHVAVVSFTLRDMTQTQYAEACAQLAPVIGATPGLLAKLWVQEPGTDTRGGVYLFEDPAAADAYLTSNLFGAVRTSPHCTNLNVRRLEVDADSTRHTQPGLRVLSPVAAKS